MRPPRLSSLSPLAGALAFGSVFFSGGLFCEWLLHSAVAGEGRQQWWSVAVILGIGCVIAAVLVYRLLDALRRNRAASEKLNHELRNALQIMAYILPTCGEIQAEQARMAIGRMSVVLREISRQLEN